MAGSRGKLTAETVEANLGDLDFAIFGVLPDEGAKVGYHPLAKTAKLVAEELNVPIPREMHMSGGQMNQRLRNLRLGGFVVDIPLSLSGGTIGWQRTAKAVARLANGDGEES